MYQSVQPCVEKLSTTVGPRTDRFVTLGKGLEVGPKTDLGLTLGEIKKEPDVLETNSGIHKLFVMFTMMLIMFEYTDLDSLMVVIHYQSPFRVVDNHVNDMRSWISVMVHSTSETNTWALLKSNHGQLKRSSSRVNRKPSRRDKTTGRQ